MPLVGGNKAALTATSITSSRTLITAEDANRRALVIRNTDAANSLYIGDVTVTAATGTLGIEVKAGEVYSDTKTRDAVYGITASATVVISGFKVI